MRSHPHPCSSSPSTPWPVPCQNSSDRYAVLYKEIILTPYLTTFLLLAPLNTSSADIDGVGTAGGGNRLSGDLYGLLISPCNCNTSHVLATERQIREFLEFLGDAPEPEWGLPEGWGTFISDLFSWATGKVITRDQAAACARRKQGKSWEVLHHELAKLGVYCWTWPVPLTIEGIKEANEAASVENQDLGLKNPLRGSLKVTSSTTLEGHDLILQRSLFLHRCRFQASVVQPLLLGSDLTLSLEVVKRRQEMS